MAAKSIKEKNEDLGPTIDQEKVLIEWKAFSRPFKRFNREFYINLGSIFVLFGLILFVIDGVMPAILVASVYFIFYVFTTVEPHTISYEITTYGIRFDNNRLFWGEMGRYRFAKRFDSTVLVVETASAPWRMEFVIDDSKRKEIEEKVSEYLYENDTPPNNFQKAAGWVSSRLKM